MQVKTHKPFRKTGKPTSSPQKASSACQRPSSQSLPMHGLRCRDTPKYLSRAYTFQIILCADADGAGYLLPDAQNGIGKDRGAAVVTCHQVTSTTNGMRKVTTTPVVTLETGAKLPPSYHHFRGAAEQRNRL